MASLCLRLFHSTAKPPFTVRQLSSLHVPGAGDGNIRSLREYAEKLLNREMEINLVRETIKKLFQEEKRMRKEEESSYTMMAVGSKTQQRREMEKMKKKMKKEMKMKMKMKGKMKVSEDVEYQRKLMGEAWKKLKR